MNSKKKTETIVKCSLLCSRFLGYHATLSTVQYLFIRLAVFVGEGEPGKRVTAMLRRSSSKGLGTSEEKIA